MKTMKRIVVAVLGIMMILSLAACGAEKTVVLNGDMSSQMGGIPTTDTWTLTAQGDIVKTVKEVMEIDLSSYDADTQEYMVSSFDALVLEPAKDIDGIVCTSRVSDNTYILEMTVTCEGDTVKKAVDAGLLTLDGNASRISLKATQSSLEGQGYKVVE